MNKNCEIENITKKSRTVKTKKEKFNFIFTNFLDNKIDIETAAKKLNITEDVFKKYLETGNNLKVPKGVIYEVLDRYKTDEITPEQGAVMLNVGIATFYNYDRKFGKRIKKNNKFNYREFKNYYTGFLLGEISAIEGAKQLGIHKSTFLFYVKTCKKLMNE